MQLALQKLQPPSILTYASALRTLARYVTLEQQPFSQQVEDALASYSAHVAPGRVWTTVSSLSWAQRLRLIPAFNPEVCRAIARGISTAAPPVIRQLWFHPADLPILSTVDLDFEAAAHVSFDLMLRAGQLDRLLCSDLDHSSHSLWYPPHKNIPFPYLRKPSPATWALLLKVHAGRAPTERLFSRASREYSDLLARITEAAYQVRFTWHTLRRGGATTRAHLGESPDAIRRFGCWSSERALTHYLFPWSALPLRSWRPNQPHPPPPTTTPQPASQPHPQQRPRPPRRPTHNRRGPRHAGPGARPPPANPPSPL